MTIIVDGKVFSNFPARYASEDLERRDREQGPMILTRILTRDGEVPPEQFEELILSLGAVPVLGKE
ncbi:MAG: hypothetical protein M3Q71_18140 [Chloroflexota bacterium]|nr:hypothetical protein [Chloroflexota bacterium]